MSFCFAQVSLSGLDRLSNNQIDAIKDELKKQDTKQVEETNTLAPSQELAESIISPPLQTLNENQFFGYNYFEQEISFFDNVPTPLEYKLGPGDEIIVSLWGEVNIKESFTINRDGLIYYSNIGFINISNKTLKEAENIIKNQFSKIYSTLNDDLNPTKLSIELGKIKSINVYFSGLINKPGINIIHPFSDIFSAIIQAGGIDQNGSLRKVQHIRQGQIISVIDFYSFFMDGINNFSNQKIIDGDIIHVPSVDNRVRIDGEVIRPQFYEMLGSETLHDLIKYAGGTTSRASSKIVLNEIIPFEERVSDDNAKAGRLIYLSEASNVNIENGTEVNLLPIFDNDTNVFVYGRVAIPGSYPAFTRNSQNGIDRNTLKDVLDIAGGFEDPIFRKTINNKITILRLDENQFYGKEFYVNYKDAENFLLEVNDQIFVYEVPLYKNEFTYTILGEVNSPGTYPLIDGLTLSDAIKAAGGVSELGSLNRLSISKTIDKFDEEGNIVKDTELVGNIDLNFLIGDKNVITILPKSNVIGVKGNVYSPGFIAHDSGKSISMSRAIELAGGYKPNSLKNRSYVIRANGEISKADFFRGKLKRVYVGDTVIVPVDPNPDDFDITSFIADLSSTLANIAAILILVDNQN